jgi:hypothetical protein
MTTGHAGLDDTLARAHRMVAQLRAEAEAVGQPRAKGLRWNATDLEKQIAYWKGYASDHPETIAALATEEPVTPA